MGQEGPDEMEGVGEGLFHSSGILARDALPLGLSAETQRESGHLGTGSQEKGLEGQVLPEDASPWDTGSEVVGNATSGRGLK